MLITTGTMLTLQIYLFPAQAWRGILIIHKTKPQNSATKIRFIAYHSTSKTRGFNAIMQLSYSCKKGVHFFVSFEFIFSSSVYRNKSRSKTCIKSTIMLFIFATTYMTLSVWNILLSWLIPKLFWLPHANEASDFQDADAKRSQESCARMKIENTE